MLTVPVSPAVVLMEEKGQQALTMVVASAVVLTEEKGQALTMVVAPVIVLMEGRRQAQTMAGHSALYLNLETAPLSMVLTAPCMRDITVDHPWQRNEFNLGDLTKEL